MKIPRIPAFLLGLALSWALPAAAVSLGAEQRLYPHAVPSISINPYVHASGNNVYVVWSTFSSVTGNSEVFFRRSTNGGESFDAAINISNAAGRADIAPIVVGNGFTVHIFWNDDVQFGSIFYARSFDNGVGFSGPAQIVGTTDSYYSRVTSTLIDNAGNLHLVFYDNRGSGASSIGKVYHKMSCDAGSTWTADAEVSIFDGDTDNEQPRLEKLSTGEIFLVFRSSRAGLPQPGWPPFQVFLQRMTGASCPAGATWAYPAQRLSRGVNVEIGTNSAANIFPGANGGLHAAWWSDSAGTNLAYRYGKPNGNGFGPQQDLSQFGINHPQWEDMIERTGFGIAEDAGGRVHAMFLQNTAFRSPYQAGTMWYRCAPSAGGNFGPKLQLAGSVTSEPRAGYANGRFHMAWMDFRHTDGNQAEIYYNYVNAVGCGAALPSDFNGDGKSDILYRNSSSGQVYRVTMNGFAVGGGALIYTEPNLNWKVVADADFNGDGVADLLWRNDATGQVYLMTFGSNGMVSGGAFVHTEPNLAWKIVHAPDLNGDGKADILWWNSSTGQVYGMLMNGAAITAQGFVYSEPNTAWKIATTGDFNGDGKADLLYRNGTTGQVFMLQMNGLAVSGGAIVYVEPNTAWKIIGSGDFNGDGRADILYRNATTGQLFVLLMNGFASSGGGVVYTEPNTAWKIVATGDYNGDGKADLLYRNDSSGQVFMILMNGLSISGAALVYVEPNTNWKIMGPWEYGQVTGILSLPAPE